MIRNRLAELLAQRQLKITRVAKDTGISRNTITSTAQNDSNMIRLETINTLCNYLSVTPQQFFDYIPIDFEYNVQFNDIMIFKDANGFLSEETVCDFDFFIDIKDHKNGKQETVCMNGQVKVHLHAISATITLDYDNNADKEVFEHYQNEIDFAFYPIVKKEIDSYLTAQISTKLGNFAQCQFITPKNFMDTNFIPTL